MHRLIYPSIHTFSVLKKCVIRWGLSWKSTVHWQCWSVVTVMSTSATTDVVFQGVTHGAVDFLIKPVRLEELRNIWQHVVRRKKDLVSWKSRTLGWLLSINWRSGHAVDESSFTSGFWMLTMHKTLEPVTPWNVLCRPHGYYHQKHNPTIIRSNYLAINGNCSPYLHLLGPIGLIFAMRWFRVNWMPAIDLSAAQFWVTLYNCNIIELPLDGDNFPCPDSPEPETILILSAWIQVTFGFASLLPALPVLGQGEWGGWAEKELSRCWGSSTWRTASPSFKEEKSGHRCKRGNWNMHVLSLLHDNML